jgi:hypothetical protein
MTQRQLNSATHISAGGNPLAEEVTSDAREQSSGWGVIRLGGLPITFILSLYLMTTSRWGSYVGIPGTPIYISDLVVALSGLQAMIIARPYRASAGAMLRSPVAFLLTMSLLIYAVLRLTAGLDLSLVSLRDFAPYGYAIVALFAFLSPARDHGQWRPVIYACFFTHLLWVVVLPRLPGFPWTLPVLGDDAGVLVARPDFDTTILGIGAAFAARDLICSSRPRRPTFIVSLAILITASLFGVVSLETRAGLLASVWGIVAVLTLSLTATPIAPKPRRLAAQSKRRALRFLALMLGFSIAAGAMILTPSGARLVAGLTDTSSGAYGTASVRAEVWQRVGDYVFRDPERTAIGVGFGRNFISESGSEASLEGDVYQNVRSPHNYIVGTLARLGVAGALIVSMIIGLGWWLALSQLRTSGDPATALAALLVLTLPVIALLGVVLESPFGAIPYFWALGQLAAHFLKSGHHPIWEPRVRCTSH